MSTALVLVQLVEAAGGRFIVDGDRLGIVPKDAATPVLEQLRSQKAAIIEFLSQRATMKTDAPLDYGRGEWLLERCVFRDRWWGGIGALHLDLACWCADHGQKVPVSRRAFGMALRREGFQVTSDGLVYGLVLKEDVLAHEQFQ